MKDNLNVLEKILKKTPFSVPIEKEIKKAAKDDNEHIMTISYKIKVIDSDRFKTSSLSSLLDNLVEGINNIKYKDCNYFLEYQRANGSLINYKCLPCKKIIQKKLMKIKKSIQTHI